MAASRSRFGKSGSKAIAGERLGLPCAQALPRAWRMTPTDYYASQGRKRREGLHPHVPSLGIVVEYLTGDVQRLAHTANGAFAQRR